MELIRSSYQSSSDEEEDVSNQTSTSEKVIESEKVVENERIVENQKVVGSEKIVHVSVDSDSFRRIQTNKNTNYDSETESVTTINISDTESDDTSELSDQEDDTKKAKKRNPPKAKGELWLEDLPPIEDLRISVPHEECEPIGVIKSIVETLVVVEAYPLTPALDIDSVLFLAKGAEALGKIFDVFGPVKHPHYCVRFNSKDHIEFRGVKVDDLVYCAPKTPHTSFVLVAQLLKFKGTDASWKDDHETPVDEKDFSDDEQERIAKGLGPRPTELLGEDGLSVPRRKIMKSKRGNNARRGQYHQGIRPPAANRQSHYVPPQVAGFGSPRFRSPYGDPSLYFQNFPNSHRQPRPLPGYRPFPPFYGSGYAPPHPMYQYYPYPPAPPMAPPGSAHFSSTDHEHH